MIYFRCRQCSKRFPYELQPGEHAPASDDALAVKRRKESRLSYAAMFVVICILTAILVAVFGKG